MKSPGIKYQILIISLLPALLVDIFFTYTNINSNITQASEQLRNKSNIIAKQIASASEYNLFSGNDAQIQHMLDQAIDTNDIVLASIYDQAGNLVAKAVSKQYKSQQSTSYYYDRQPIMSLSELVADVFAPDQETTQQSQTLGWVHLYISRSRLEQAKTEIYRDSILFFITVLMVAIILSIALSRRITRPIFGLMDHLKNVEKGRLGETISQLEQNEIGSVQAGFNRMTGALLANRLQLNLKIQQATQKLSEAITNLETKNRELGFARDEAQNANRAKSEFLANMSHEIRTPINGIKGFISLLSQSNLDQRQQRYTDIILKSTSDLTSIIDEILDFSKMESGKMQIIEDDFNLHEVIEQTRDILFITVLTKNIDLNLIIFSDTPKVVCGDKLRLKQILLNLVGNAIKFTDQGKVVIRVSMEKQTAVEAGIMIEIIDTGIGITEHDQAHLFTAFSQVDSADNRRFSGTGLGLVISKNLANLMGGDISMQSRSGEGSVFTIRIPFSIPSTIQQADPDTSSNDESALVFASEKTCLQEILSLFNRIEVLAESVLLDNPETCDDILNTIQRSLNLVDFVVFDLRHLNCDLTKILTDQITSQVQVIVMHYDQSMLPEFNNLDVKYISVVSTAISLRQQLDFLKSGPSQESVKSIDIAPTKSRRVLIVDDNEINLFLGSELLRLWGHHVIEASHANDAISLYRAQNFDLIILDIQMPDIDGTELLKMMRKEKPGDETPIVALTAQVLPNDADKLLGMGFDSYLCKPIDEQNLKAIIEGNLKRQPAVSKDPVAPEFDSTAKSIDISRSLTLCANNQSLMQQIFGILSRDASEYQDQLKISMNLNDVDKLSGILHKLHGVTCYASLPLLKPLILSSEQQLSRVQDDIDDSLVLSIIEELENIKQELTIWFSQNTAVSTQPAENESVNPDTSPAKPFHRD